MHVKCVPCVGYNQDILKMRVTLSCTKHSYIRYV